MNEQHNLRFNQPNGGHFDPDRFAYVTYLFIPIPLLIGIAVLLEYMGVRPPPEKSAKVLYTADGTKYFDFFADNPLVDRKQYVRRRYKTLVEPDDTELIAKHIENAYQMFTSSCRIPIDKLNYDDYPGWAPSVYSKCKTPILYELNGTVLHATNALPQYLKWHSDANSSLQCCFAVLRYFSNMEEDVKALDRRLLPSNKSWNCITRKDHLEKPYDFGHSSNNFVSWVFCDDSTWHHVHRFNHESSYTHLNSKPNLPAPKNALKASEEEQRNRSNFFVVDLAGMSRHNFPRQMPHTAKFLRESPNCYDFEMYTTDDDMLSSAIIPFTGMNGDHFAKWCRNKSHSDECPRVWRFYKDKMDYITSFGLINQYDKVLTLFEYEHERQEQHDTYFWPHPDPSGTLSGFSACFNNTGLFAGMLDYGKNLIDLMNGLNRSYFQILIDAPLSNHINGHGFSDDYYRNYLEELFKEHSHNMVFIFFSSVGQHDYHSKNHLKYRIQDNMPVLHICVNETVRNATHMRKHLAINRKRMTSPYDLFCTLLRWETGVWDTSKHCLSETVRNAGYTAYDLAREEVPEQRDDAEIQREGGRGVCQVEAQLSPDNVTFWEVSKAAAQYTLDLWNWRLFRHPECWYLWLVKLRSATLWYNPYFESKMPWQDWTTIRDFALVFETRPDDGLYGVIVRTRNRKRPYDFHIVGEIKELHAKRRHCLKKYPERLYCACRTKGVN